MTKKIGLYINDTNGSLSACFLDRYSNDLLITLTETSHLRQDEWPARGDIKWSEQEWNPRQRCSDLGETLDSGGDAAERCQLVLGGRHWGESQTLLTDLNYRRFGISFLHAVSFEIMKCVVLSVVFLQLMISTQFPFFHFTALPLPSRLLPENAVKDAWDWEAAGQSNPWHQGHGQLPALRLQRFPHAFQHAVHRECNPPHWDFLLSLLLRLLHNNNCHKFEPACEGKSHSGPLVTKHFFWLCGPLQRVYDEEVEEAVKTDGMNKQPEQVRNSLCNGSFHFQGCFRDKSGIWPI